jgi:signal transduction histidine kinase
MKMMTDKEQRDKPAQRDKDPLRRAREDLDIAEQALRITAGWEQGPDDPLAKLLKVVERINAELDVQRVLTVAAEQIIEIFEAERVFIADVGPEDGIRFRLAVTFKGRPIPGPENEVSHAVIHDVARKREPILVADATTDPRFAQVSSVLHLQLHSVMAAPLMARGELLGVVYADNRLVSGAFNQHTLNLLGIFANHVGIALRNAQLFHELDAARMQLALSERLRAIGEVATFIAHEVKNPLGSIQILVGALQERWAEPELRAKVFEVVPREVDRLNRAVSQILDYARPTPLIKVPVSLVSLAESALEALGPQIERQQVRVHTDFGLDVPVVLADGERVREVLVNLVKNSLEAMGEAPRKELRVTVRRQDEAHVEIALEDSGAGIPDDELPHVFEPFRTSKKTGTGVGLALCQKVVREHGGQITAENIPHGGARFRLSLPVSGA